MYYFKRTYRKYLILLAIFFIIIQAGCDLKEPAAPEWDIFANLPIVNKYYYVYDILKNTSNVYYDSSSRRNVVLTGSARTANQFGTDIKSDGVPETQYAILTNYILDTTVQISYDDSTQASFLSFLNGELILKFNNVPLSPYYVTLTLENLRSKSDTTIKYFRNDIYVSNSPVIISIPLSNWVYKSNAGLSNQITVKLRTTTTGIIALTSFTSRVTAYEVEKIIGRIKPTYIARETDKVDSPFGRDVPEGILNFYDVDTASTYLLVKRYANLYQLDFSEVSVVGVNKNGRKISLKYKQSGGPPSPADTIFSLRLEQNKDSSVFKLNNSNSNITEFISNIPVDIYVSKALTINKPYATGTVYHLDSFSTSSQFSIPLNFNISQTNAVIQKDTTDFGISDSDQRDKIKNTMNLEVELRLSNRMPLSAISKVLVLDSFFVPLFSLSQIAGNPSDSTVSVGRAPTDANGYVNGFNQQVYRAVLTKTDIDKLLRAGKVIYDTRFYTDQNPTAFVRLTKYDYTRVVGLGKIEYRVKENN